MMAISTPYRKRILFPALAAAILFGSVLPADGPRSDKVSMSIDHSYDLKMTPPVMSSRIYYEGSETLGRVGHEAILKRDIHHQIRKYAYLEFLRQKEEAPDEEKGKFNDDYFRRLQGEFLASGQLYSQVLEGYICELLFYNDYVVSRSKEEIEQQNKQLEKTFNSEYIPHLLEQMKCENRDELEDLFREKFESSLEEEKRLFVQQTISGSWVAFNLGSEEWEPASHDLRRYYENHLADYARPEKVRWLKMTVYFANHPTKREAYEKIAYMGNAVRSSSSKEGFESIFMKVAQTDSEDMFASKGGQCGWTLRGKLSSAVIEDALFSDNLPVGAMSKILEDESGVSIICVLERQREHTVPFVEVQEEIVAKIKEERQKSLKAKYESELAKRFAVQIYKISPEEQKSRLEAVSSSAVSATGRNEDGE